MQGYLPSTKKYTGTVSLSMLKSGVRNKTLKLGEYICHIVKSWMKEMYNVGFLHYFLTMQTMPNWRQDNQKNIVVKTGNTLKLTVMS